MHIQFPLKSTGIVHSFLKAKIYPLCPLLSWFFCSSNHCHLLGFWSCMYVFEGKMWSVMSNTHIESSIFGSVYIVPFTEGSQSTLQLLKSYNTSVRCNCIKFYSWVNWSTERLNNLPKDKLVSSLFKWTIRLQWLMTVLKDSCSSWYSREELYRWKLECSH